MNGSLFHDARSIWQAAVDAVRPFDLLSRELPKHADLLRDIESARRILVIGAGKASAGMAESIEAIFAEHLSKMDGVVNVPDDLVRPLRRIRLHGARPAGSNHPTTAGVDGAEEMLDRVAACAPDDVALCLISGGGSALLPAPDGVTLADKQAATRVLHACGASIGEMNAVRKHLSRIKGGRLAEAFRGRAMYALIISDVIGNPLDVIASGPTVPDPVRFADLPGILDRLGIRSVLPPAVLQRIEAGIRGEVPDTPKTLPDSVRNIVIGDNALALRAAEQRAAGLGYPVLNLGSFFGGETRPTAETFSALIRSIRADGVPVRAPLCLVSGGETTVTLPPGAGKGGRNQEFALAMLNDLGRAGCADLAVICGGTDGEDGPTDSAGAIFDGSTWATVDRLGLNPWDALQRHDAYPFWSAAGGLVRTGLTGTNVMDVRVMMVGRRAT